MGSHLKYLQNKLKSLIKEARIQNGLKFQSVPMKSILIKILRKISSQAIKENLVKNRFQQLIPSAPGSLMWISNTKLIKYKFPICWIKKIQQLRLL